PSFSLLPLPPPSSPSFPYTTLFRSPPDCGRPWHPCAPRVCAALLPRIPLRQGGEARVEHPWRRPLLPRAGARDQHARVRGGGDVDRKSTRLNSSHVAISYAVFCLKK